MKLKLCICVHDVSLYRSYIFYYRFPCAFVAMATFPILIMGNMEIGVYLCVTVDILAKVLLKSFWSSPLPTIRILSKSLILIGGMQHLQYFG